MPLHKHTEPLPKWMWYVIYNCEKPNRSSLSRSVADPRKELIAIVEGVHIAVIALKAFEGRFKELIMWTDAMTVLAWLTNDAIKPSKYIRRKLDKLNTLHRRFRHVEFKYIPTDQNPADVASRDLNLVYDGENRI